MYTEAAMNFLSWRQTIDESSKSLLKHISIGSTNNTNLKEADRKVVFVAIRIQSLNEFEKRRGDRSCCAIDESNTIRTSAIVMPKAAESPFPQRSSRDFSFDVILDEQSSQAEVFEKTTEPFIGKLFYGDNVTIMACGTAPSGKTIPMFGSTSSTTVRASPFAVDTDMGIVPRAIYDTLEAVKSRQRDVDTDAEDLWETLLGYLEVHNDEVYDLLNDRAKLNVKEDDIGEGGINDSGTKVYKVATIADVMALIAKGEQHRTTSNYFSAATTAADKPYRSHAVLQLTVRRIRIKHGTGSSGLLSPNPYDDPGVQDTWKTAAGDGFDDLRSWTTSGINTPMKTPQSQSRDEVDFEVMESKLTFIDLATAESLTDSELLCLDPTTRDVLQNEDNLIRESLSALFSSCISDEKQVVIGQEEYRRHSSNKLTLLLKHCLEGRKSHLTLIANINPSHRYYEDTINTLTYASSAKGIEPAYLKTTVETVSTVDEQGVLDLVRQYQHLQMENSSLQDLVSKQQEAAETNVREQKAAHGIEIAALQQSNSALELSLQASQQLVKTLEETLEQRPDPAPLRRNIEQLEGELAEATSKIATLADPEPLNRQIDTLAAKLKESEEALRQRPDPVPLQLQIEELQALTKRLQAAAHKLSLVGLPPNTAAADEGGLGDDVSSAPLPLPFCIPFKRKDSSTGIGFSLSLAAPDGLTSLVPPQPYNSPALTLADADTRGDVHAESKDPEEEENDDRNDISIGRRVVIAMSLLLLVLLAAVVGVNHYKETSSTSVVDMARYDDKIDESLVPASSLSFPVEMLKYSNNHFKNGNNDNTNRVNALQL